ncbi:hypothetical protein [Peribacillus huizhouensis]|uniref:Uncharacterized protein n=1 Tax=Peribacillus huizhouensis TaxID=1501239 RepID=A0ABR6CRM7_9BACI|nr:hypothetical protein [Peribacillus huizhouensis]MBA9027581.1 hypothetical protein [Peribacillus huizhouensis]
MITQAELDAIRARAEENVGGPYEDEDVPTLLAEVERLNAELKSIAESIDEYYENEDDDIPIYDLLGSIRDDAERAVSSDD